MTHLSEFFDAERFFRDKVLVATSSEEWRDYDDKTKILGTKVTAVIYQDNTPYLQREGQCTTNLFEKLTIKVKKPNLQIAPKTRVTLHNPVCRVYGKFNENLSVVCDDLQIVPPKS